MNVLPRSVVVALSALLACTLCLPAFGQWKWREKNGLIQYSDLPPPLGTPAHDILQRPEFPSVRNAASSPAAAPSSAASGAPLLTLKGTESELEIKRKKAEQGVADKKKSEEAKLAAAKFDNCTRAKMQMQTINSGVRLARTNEKGERVNLDDAGRAAEMARAREVMNLQCQ